MDDSPLCGLGVRQIPSLLPDGLLGSAFLLFFVGALWSGEAAAFAPVSDTSRSRSTTSVFDPEAGRFLRRYIDPDTYEANRQNWDATQDSSGVLYVANSDGVLIFDGHAWRTLPIPNRMGATTVTADAKGRVFVGASEEFGMIRTDSHGRKQYVSLSNRLPEKHKDFGEIQHTEVTDDAVYFQTTHRLF